MDRTSRKVIKVSLSKLTLVVGLIILVIAAVWFSYEMNNKGMVYEELGAPSIGMETPPMPPTVVYDNSGMNITDTREFLKTNFSADIRTRDVKSAVDEVKNAVGDAQGRVDNISSGNKRGYVSFVVPKSKFEAFRSRVESITHSKLYTENVSSYNLLGQQQSYEQQTASATSTLVSLQRDLQTINNQHAQRVSSLNYRIATVQNELADVRQKMYVSEDPESWRELQSQEAVLMQNIEALNQDLINENNIFRDQNQNLVDQITYIKGVIANLDQQHETFKNDLETVNGYISVSWISWWDMAEKISPIHPLIIILVLIIVILFVLYRRGSIPKIEFV